MTRRIVSERYGCLNSGWDLDMSTSGPRTALHIALVGNTGVGKSTLVNVLTGREIAEVNNNVRPCTARATPYDLVQGNTRYCIWDTRGLNEGSENAAPVARVLKAARILPDADRELKKFLRNKNPGVKLVLLCVDAKKIRVDVHWKIYNKIYADFCKKGLTVGVVVMQIGENDLRGSEWKNTCRSTAMRVAEGFPDARLIEAVPKFEELDDPIVRVCRDRILKLISDACRK